MSAPAPDSLPSRWQVVLRWGAPALTLATLAFLALNCAFNPKLNFLAPGPGKWIVYPLPPDVNSYPGFELAGTFRHSFVLPEKPSAALLSWRCLTNGEVHINGTVVPSQDSSSENWKKAAQLDISSFLRQGTNEISVIVKNQLGPPALSIELNSGDFLLVSDESWEVSVSGSNWRAARAASATPRPGKGNPLYLLEATGGAFQRCWLWLCLFGVISVCVVALLENYIARARKIIVVLLAAAWVLLFLHNIRCLPPVAGFDASPHLDYVRYIQDYKKLPPPSEGWETFQAPLYYIISATLLDLAHCQVFTSAGLIILRILSLGIGVINLALVFIGLRLIFPGDWKKPLAGLVLAAFLPAQIYLLHYTTNETLSAMFVTGMLCLGLYLLRAGQRWWGWYGVLGIVLGLALLSKASAVLAVPMVMGTLAVNLMLRRERALRVWLGTIVAPLLICLLIGGWHYLKLWQDYGNPLAGNWDPKVVEPWWQAKGFQTPGYYFSFGDSLILPFCSGFHSFWDGFYSTLWGDGLLGGSIDMLVRPPWNYDLMAVGFVLALVPSALVLTGLVRALVGCFRTANLPWLLLLGLGWFFAFAILGMSLKMPSYAQTKAFYGLPVLLPFCALGALGFEFWSGRGKVLRYVLGVALGIWLVNVYASFWIKPHSVECELSSAIARNTYLKEDVSGNVLNLLHQYPSNIKVILLLATLESKTDAQQAVERLEQAVKDGFTDAQLESELAGDLVLCDRWDEALVHAKRAVELAPEDAVSCQNWCALALLHKNYGEAVTAARAALSLNPAELRTQSNLGVALLHLGQITEATSHFLAIVNAQPTAQSQCYLGICLLNQPGKRDEALTHLREAVRLDPTNTKWQEALQNALMGH